MKNTLRQRIGEQFSLITLLLWALRVGVFIVVLWGSINTLASGRYEASTWINLVIAGLAQGSIYALIALGYSLVYGILRFINFAHGEVFMAGAFTSVFVAEALERSGFFPKYPILTFAILLIVSMTSSTVVAVLLERIAYRPLRNAPRLVPLITAIGASFFLQYTFRGLYGSGFHTYPEFGQLWGVWNIAGMDIQIVQVFVFLASLLMMAGLYLIVERTKTGKAMRAVSEDKEIAALMGIDVNRVIVITFVIGGMLAGSAGVIRGMYQPQGIWFFMGFHPGLKAFTAAVLGGIGNIPGAMLGGLFLGVFETVGPTLILQGLGIPAANQLKDAIAIIMLVLVLIFRPQGILGEKLAEEKA
ncbi:MAG: branched-chain amino acid ABC transporter permease [Chloroflexi bacterium]|nr:branched-chain amino acid ABC transporter permease [Chloroflexota bacterium]